MKIYILLIVFLCMFKVHAQKTFVVTESTERIGDSISNLLSVSVYEASIDDIEKAWKRLMRDYKAKLLSNNEILADNAIIPSISANTVDVYAKIERVSALETKLKVSVDMGGIFINSKEYAPQYNALKELLLNFAYKTTKEAIAEQLDMATKELKQLVSDKESLVKSNDNLHKKIENLEKDIITAKEGIKANEQEQVNNQKLIEAQQRQVEIVKAKDAEIH